MKSFFTKIFSPILNIFENAEGEYIYQPSHRKILMVMGLLFFGISAVGLYFSLQINQMEGLLPVILFSSIGFICLIVAFLGSNKAVAKIWRNK